MLGGHSQGDCMGLISQPSEISMVSKRTGDALESKLLPFGDFVTDTIAVVCAEILAAEQLHVDEEEFKATQSKVKVARMPAPLQNPPSDDPKLKGVLHTSIDLFGKGNMEEEDIEQEVKGTHRKGSKWAGDGVDAGRRQGEQRRRQEGSASYAKRLMEVQQPWAFGLDVAWTGYKGGWCRSTQGRAWGSSSVYTCQFFICSTIFVGSKPRVFGL
ncbi:hypothetical protein L7F22_036395 [Adiantum nelumboides]|nr:hypothetical protein [Adiantum nelumboides]